MHVSQTFTALKYPNFRLWFFGQLVSLLGTWMQMVAQSYLVFELTKSPAFLGYVNFAFGLPSWIFMLYSGVISDRMSRRKLMLIAQSTMMLLAFVLTWLTFSGQIQPWHIVILAFLLGVATAFDAPARQAIIFELVDKQDITNAVALNSTLFNLSAVAGPAAAGVIYMAFGPEWCFAVNTVSYLAVITALILIKLEGREIPLKRSSTLSSLKEGIKYTFSEPDIWPVMYLVGATTLFGFSFATLMPAWAVTILEGDATTNGLLQAARGGGAVLSALFLASLGRFAFRGKLISFSAFVFPILLVAFAMIRNVTLALFMLVLVGIALQLLINLSNAILQTQSKDSVRGRVLSIYSLTHFGFMPIGGLFAGMMAEFVGEPVTVILSSAALLLSVSILWIKAPQLRTLK